MIDLDQVRARVSLVDLVAETVRLKKHGQQHYGLCPFHSDKSPTLRVDPKKQLWMCPSCGIGGDCFSWIKTRDAVPFRVAAQDLAKRAGVEPGAHQDAPKPISAPKLPKYPAPFWEPNLPWGGGHLMRYGLPVIVLNDFPGRQLYLSIAETMHDHDVIWFPRLSSGLTAPAERMYLAPIVRAEIWIAPSRDPWEQRRGRELERLLWRWRGYAIAAGAIHSLELAPLVRA